MGFLREREISGRKYFYWCVRERDRVKSGGEGKVKSYDICIGRFINDRSLAYWAYVGEINPNEYAETFIQWQLQQWRRTWQEKRLDCDITANLKMIKGEPVIEFRSKGIDLRQKVWRDRLGYLRRDVEEIWHVAVNSLEPWINFAVENLSQYDEYSQKAKDTQDEFDRYLKDPSASWEVTRFEYDEVEERKRNITYTMSWVDNAYQLFEDKLGFYRNGADRCLRDYQRHIESIIEHAPKKHRTEFRKKILADVECRAKSLSHPTIATP